MSQRRRLQRQQRERRQRERQAQEQSDVAQDTAARFSCSTEIAEDFANQCEHRLEDLRVDLIVTRLALEMWTGREGPALVIVDALTAMAAERQRHADAIAELGRRFAALAVDESIAHHHLEPVEPYRDLVRQRLFIDPAPKDEE